MRELVYMIQVYASLALIVGVIALTCYMAPSMFIDAKTIEQSLTQTIKQ